MNGLVLLIIGLAVLLCGYIFYGRWLCKQWGVGENNEATPHTLWKMVLTMSPQRPPS